MKITIPVSVGELIDKITILEIKSLFTNSEYVQKELEELNLIKSTLTVPLVQYSERLREINRKLWKVEDELRILEENQDFGEKFIELARSVYVLNDNRAEVKSEINEITNSYFREVKVY